MAVNIRELSRNTSGVVDEVTTTGRPALVTKNGQPVAAIVPVDASDWENLVLSKTPEFLADLAAADDELTAGRTRDADDVFAEFED